MENYQTDIVCINGQIIYKRIFGKKLAFIYILCENDKEQEVMLNNKENIKLTKIGQIIKLEASYQLDIMHKNQLIPHKIEILDCIDISKTINHKRNFLQNHSNKPTEERSLCKLFKKLNYCNLSNCLFRHNLIIGENERLELLTSKKHEAFKRVHEDDPINKENKFKKLQRHRLFSQFLIDKFGIEHLKSGYVLDIAGGKGMVSYYLTTDYNIKSIIVDPRGVFLPKKHKKNLRNSNIEIERINDIFDEKFDENLIIGSNLIIGMHPDEATVDIVKLSIKYKKSFAIVPCCVFPSIFEDRYLSNGERVIDYTDLVKFIIEMVDNPKIDFLNFEGRNKVIYKIY